MVYAGYVGCSEECVFTLNTLQELENSMGSHAFQNQNVYFINLFKGVSQVEAQRYVDRFVSGVTVLNPDSRIDSWLERVHINYTQPLATSDGLIIDHPNLFYHFLRKDSGWTLERLSPNHLINRLSD